ncbi:hypothetical protein WMY93_032238 [Mugilogobius chulae]|uniref:acyl-CoA (8-3)-desaturase n=1 Tax=Mugilogobius chulae TaxID=88201 RepID=A0AAW0MJU5_9GOBI
MGRGAELAPGSSRSPAVFTWEEVQKHSLRSDQWLVIDRKVYNVTQWTKKHPGGSRLIQHFAGEDATEAFTAFHPDLTFVQKFLKPLFIGELAADEPMMADFQALLEQVKKEGMFESQPWFFFLHLAHILVLEGGAWLLLRQWGTGWGPTLLCSVLLTIVQAQASWLQHDFGHLSVFRKSSWNHFAHKFVMGHLKGISSKWWNHRHFQHHAKPNILSKDPDIKWVKVLVVGTVEPVEELIWFLTFYLRYLVCFVPLYGLLGTFTLITFVRFLESHWFVWVTQMNHLPMDINHEKRKDWVNMQLEATCNVEQSTFNDWFTGHLNFQIEHHLFPTMPRHNYHKVAPLVKTLSRGEMGRGAELAPGSSRSPAVFTWEEVQKHSLRSDQWLVIDRKVYNVTQWAKKHPGGSRLIQHFAGEDATEAFTAFHPDLTFVQKFLKPLFIGELAADEPSQDNNKNAAVMADFQALLEQAQASWLQHDFGHLSVFRKSSWNHFVQRFIIGHLKGVSSKWWNHRHFQHHAKPNIFSKDPDIKWVKILVVGTVEPVEFGVKKIKLLPYNHQHKYFFLVGPPLIIPLLFHTQAMYLTIKLKHWEELVWSLTFYLRYLVCFVPLYGLLGTFALLTFVRFLESHWFVWVTQMNHLPMDINHEKRKDWVNMQLEATCNVEQSTFNDWFTGHLNFQIEHHLFPTMPRHNYHKVAPLVKTLCEKHGIKYQNKSLSTAVVDVFWSLKNSGELWLDAYLHK